ncbi:MAG: response regulator [Ignavibacteriales bacterium]|nr:response regulator [Ignavibacteriales bacterium]
MIAAHQIEILLIEDDANDAEMTMMALRKYQLDEKVLLIRDGAEALDFIHAFESGAHPVSTNTLRLIILDLKLPKVNGIEVLRRLKSGEGTKTIPVTILTSSAERQDIIECYQAGANSFVVKPVEFNKFIETVGELGRYWIEFNLSIASTATRINKHDVTT